MQNQADSKVNWKDYILNIPNYPKEGVNFKDITPLLANPSAFKQVIDLFEEFCRRPEISPDQLSCPEARGFMFAPALAYVLGTGFLPVRKPGKLPRKTCSVKYDLEYGVDELQMHIDDIKKGQKIVLVDDVLATGGTMAACIKLIEQQGATVTACIFVMELDGLKGREKIAEVSTSVIIHSLINL